MAQRIIHPDLSKYKLSAYLPVVEVINELEPRYERLSDDGLRYLTDQFRTRLAHGESLKALLPEAFAAVREAAKRTLGQRHHDVQLIGGIALHEGKIAEMEAGEGKTLVATLPLYLYALTGLNTHLVTINDYLARRDARWMAPIYNMLGMSVGVLQMAQLMDNGRNALLVDLEKESPQEDQHQLRLVRRVEAYMADITYGTNSEFGFDYLRDHMTNNAEDRVQRGLNFALVDEVDLIFIDEARTPLIISAPSGEDTEYCLRMAQVVRGLNPEDYEVNERDRSVSLTEIGAIHVEDLLGIQLLNPDRPEDVTPEQARLMGYLEQSLRAQFLYRRNKDYLIQGGKAIIIDEFTGHLMPGRRWSDGLHQAVEAKEGLKVEPENTTYATITIQNYFRMYQKLAGMSGTAMTEAEEFRKFYKLDVLPIPTNLNYLSSRSSSPYELVEDKDDSGYKFTYYARRSDPERKPIFFRRKDYPDVVYRTEEAKLRAMVREIMYFHILGRPQLVGTASIEHSERVSWRLNADFIRRLAQVLLLREVYLEMKNLQDSLLERAIPELQPLNTPLEMIEVGYLRQLARGLGIRMSFNPEEPANIERLMYILGLPDGCQAQLTAVLQGGIPHQVLNGRRHDDEAKIIANAGMFGRVTIATNMAGRGVDIMLGGELDEAILSGVNRVLNRSGYDAFNMSDEERCEVLQKLDSEEIGIYASDVERFTQYVREMEQVHQLGGLHVIGSERHEARRIDNQLRGRAARQGDPGSSRFYLSLDDELMRLFGGQQVVGMLKRLSIDENLPIESGVVGRLVEQSQERVEGVNFDVRKKLLEYDDVLNLQRARIYEQRDQIFTKEDLSDDLTEIVWRTMKDRIPLALQEIDGCWKLAAYLDEIQPSFHYDDMHYPSFSLRVLKDWLVRSTEALSPAEVRTQLLDLAASALDAGQEHLLDSIDQLIQQAGDTLQAQLEERFTSLDHFLDGLLERDDAAFGLQELSTEVAEVIRIPQFRLTDQQLSLAQNDPHEFRLQMRDQVMSYLIMVTFSRVVGAIERRLGVAMQLRPQQIVNYPSLDWDEVGDYIFNETSRVLAHTRSRLLSEDHPNEIAQDLDPYLEKLNGALPTDEQWLDLLTVMQTKQRLVFDRAKHRQAVQQTHRLNYAFLVGKLLESQPVKEVMRQVLNHLDGALAIQRQMWGRFEWKRLMETGITLSQLDPRLKTRLASPNYLGEEAFHQLFEQPLETLAESQRNMVQELLGWYDQNEAARQLLLSATTEQWVDYLTHVEALRVSIGLEAYAKRDPLIEYRSQAVEMFHKLNNDIRMSFVSRIFTYRPRAAAKSEEPVEGN